MTSQQQSLKKEADVVFQQHHVKKAAELYTNAINADPSSELAGTLFSNRSLCHHKLGNFQEALKDGITATTLKPNWARGYLRVASAYESLGKENEAIDAYQKSLDLEENQDARQKYIALFRKNVDNMKKTQEEFKIIGNGYVQKKKYDEAVIIYNASIDLDPSIESAAPIYSNRSLAFFHLGRFQEAEDDACMAIFLKPEFARGYLRRGNATMILEKWKESFEAFEKYFELDPENAKSDPDLVKNKNSVRRLYDQKEDEKQRHEKMIETKRAELMAIKDENERKKKSTTLMNCQLQTGRLFDVDLVRLLVESGADLTPTRFDPQQNRDVPVNSASAGDADGSLLMSLLLIRAEVPPKVLPQLDELIFFIIDEMLRRDIPFVGWELSVSCSSRAVGPVSAKLARVLLETNKFDVNRNFGEGRPPPLTALVMGMDYFAAVPREIPDCLHLLLNWKGIDVNRIWRFKSGERTEEHNALSFVRHHEVAKILIRHGADVNAVLQHGPAPTNILDRVFSDPENPDLEQLIRLLIQSGVRLLPSGRDGKSSTTIMAILAGNVGPKTSTKSFASEEILQMMLQLNLQQGLLFRFQSATSFLEIPFLFSAIYDGAPFRFVELLCAMNPAPMKETGKYEGGEVMPISYALNKRIRNNSSSFEESMRILGLLLEHGFDLFEQTVEDSTATSFALLWTTSDAGSQDTNLLKKTIIEKRGEQEFQRCMKTLK